jgi:hypothetical protein
MYLIPAPRLVLVSRFGREEIAAGIHTKRHIGGNNYFLAINDQVDLLEPYNQPHPPVHDRGRL